jgi:hypothetical protein
MEDSRIYEVAGGDIKLWLDGDGPIMLKVQGSAGDPVELAEHEALELAELLTRLVEVSRT